MEYVAASQALVVPDEHILCHGDAERAYERIHGIGSLSQYLDIDLIMVVPATFQVLIASVELQLLLAAVVETSRMD